MDQDAGPARYRAFAGEHCIATGELAAVAAASAGRQDVLVFEETTGRRAEIDRAGQAVPAPAARGPGRPKLGVVAREVTLLPRHWDWLGSQPGGASVALRRLVDEARKASAAGDRLRLAQEAAYRFMAAVAGDRPGFEEASRALFAGRKADFAARIASWPADIRDFAATLASGAFAAGRP